MKVALTPHSNIVILTLSTEHVGENFFPVNAHASKVFGKRDISIKKPISCLNPNYYVADPFPARVFTALNNTVLMTRFHIFVLL